MNILSETRTRTILKVITWRVLLTISHVVNAFVITGSLITGLQIAGMAAVINSILFWLHERIWNIAQWNRKENEQVYTEGQPRTLGKIVTWRIAITLSNFFIPFLMTGSFGAAAIFTGVATVVNMLIFWAHERVWDKLSFGKIRASSDLTSELRSV